jgi:hypothetical protein
MTGRQVHLLKACQARRWPPRRRPGTSSKAGVGVAGWRRVQWSSYARRMTNPMAKILLALLTFAMMTHAVSAQSRTFYDSRGNVVGRAASRTGAL